MNEKVITTEQIWDWLLAYHVACKRYQNGNASSKQLYWLSRLGQLAGIFAGELEYPIPASVYDEIEWWMSYSERPSHLSVDRSDYFLPLVGYELSFDSNEDGGGPYFKRYLRHMTLCFDSMPISSGIGSSTGYETLVTATILDDICHQLPPLKIKSNVKAVVANAAARTVLLPLRELELEMLCRQVVTGVMRIAKNPGTPYLTDITRFFKACLEDDHGWPEEVPVPRFGL